MKVAVVGVGALGRHHARIYSQMEGVELAAVVDIDEDRGAAVAREYGTRFLKDWRELPPWVQAVSLAVPTTSHAEIACPLLMKAVDVLVEKPIAAGIDDASRMISASWQGDARLHVGHSERFNPAMRAARPHIRDPGFFEVHRLGAFPGRGLDVDVVLDLMIHDIDLILHMVDSEVEEVRAVGIPVLTDKVDIANARLQFANGCVANLTASRISLEKIRKLRLFQPHDYISIDLAARQVEMYSLDQSGEGPASVLPRRFEVEEAEPLRAEIEAFLKGSPEACTGEQARRALKLGLEIRAAIDRQKKVRELTRE